MRPNPHATDVWRAIVDPKRRTPCLMPGSQCVQEPTSVEPATERLSRKLMAALTRFPAAQGHSP